MISKYLDVPLKYRIVYRTSRSGISDEVRRGLPQPPVFQLFSKGVEKQRFDYAVKLLSADVHILLHSRGITLIQDPDNILENINLLIRHEIPF